VVYLDLITAIGLLAIILHQYRRTGLLLLPSSTWLLTSIIISVYVAYFYATTPESLGAIGQQYNAVGMEIAGDELLGIVSVAVLCAMLAYTLGPKLLPRFSSAFTGSRLKTGLRMNELTAGACISALLGIALVWFFFSSIGEIPLLARNPVSAREEILANNPMRFLYTAGFTMSGVGVTFLIAALALGKIRSYKAFAWGTTILVCATNLLTATRGNFLTPFAVAATIYFSIRSKQLTLARLPILMGLALLAAAALQMLRTRGAYGWNDLTYEVLHGNTFFANFRDTAWVLMNFERHRYPFMHGKTILAGFLGFLPRSVFPFREEYGWGFVSKEVVHNTSLYHPGLGHVVFGDWYINFGYPGVVVEGFTFGLILRLLDSRLVYVVRRRHQISEADVYFAVFKIWFAVGVLGYLFSSALTVLLYPYFLGYCVMVFAARLTGAIFGRPKTAEWAAPRWVSPGSPGRNPLSPDSSRSPAAKRMNQTSS
jgi:oligosaccharide repeat unit polymerase